MSIDADGQQVVSPGADMPTRTGGALLPEFLAPLYFVFNVVSVSESLPAIDAFAVHGESLSSLGFVGSWNSAGLPNLM